MWNNRMGLAFPDAQVFVLKSAFVMRNMYGKDVRYLGAPRSVG